MTYIWYAKAPSIEMQYFSRCCFFGANQAYFWPAKKWNFECCGDPFASLKLELVANTFGKFDWSLNIYFRYVSQRSNAAAGLLKYWLVVTTSLSILYESIGNPKEKNLAKFRRIVSLQFWRNLRGEECSISPARQAAATEAFEKNWKSTLLIMVSRFHVFGFIFVLWFPNSFGVMLLMFHFLSTVWALILSFTFSVSKNPFELDWLWKNLWVGREVASQ